MSTPGVTPLDACKEGRKQESKKERRGVEPRKGLHWLNGRPYQFQYTKGK
jgi:hypothetical protein